MQPLGVRLNQCLLVVLNFAFRAIIFILSLFTLSCPLSLYSSVPLFTEIQRTRIRAQISMRVMNAVYALVAKVK